MTVTILSDDEIMPYEQRVMEAINKHEGVKAAELIKNGTAEDLFKPDTKNLSKKTALHYAIIEGYTENALALINKEGVTAEKLFQQEDRLKYTPLHEAIVKKNRIVALALINKDGITIEQLSLKNKFGQSAANLANENHMQDVVVAIESKINSIKRFKQPTLTINRSQGRFL